MLKLITRRWNESCRNRYRRGSHRRTVTWKRSAHKHNNWSRRSDHQSASRRYWCENGGQEEVAWWAKSVASEAGSTGKIVIHLTEFNAFATDINHCDAQDKTGQQQTETEGSRGARIGLERSAVLVSLQ